MSAVTRIGIAGIENTHAEEIIRYLNVERDAVDGVRVTALVRADDDDALTERLAALGGIDTIVSDAADLLTQVDAFIVTSRDGARHRALAVPFLESGIPVWVDKPLATTVDDARAIQAAAEAGGTVVTSSSALRWAPDVDALAAAIPELGNLQTLTITTSADPGSEYSGIFFYGIHAADIAQRLVPGDARSVDVLTTMHAVIARYQVGEVVITLEMILPDEHGRAPFRAVAVGRHGAAGGDIHPGPDYVEPGVDAFIEMLASRRQPIAWEQMIAPIAILQDVRAQHASERV